MEQKEKSAGLVVAYKPNWKRWHTAGFTSELLPIIPIDAKLSPTSKVLPETRGKVPGYLITTGWIGLSGKWSDKLFPKEKHVNTWVDRWGAGLGSQGRVLNGSDIDVNDPMLAKGIYDIVVETLGPTCVRTREGSPRMLLMYKLEKGAVISKWRIAFRDGTGVEHAFEWLGKGFYYNIDGLHPSGVPYKWNDPHPCDVGFDNIPVVTEKQVASLSVRIIEYLEMMGCELVKQKKHTVSGDAVKLDDTSLHAATPQLVLEALALWKNTDENLPTHDDFVLALRAIKASLGPDREQHYGDVLDWALGYDGNDDAYVKKTWDSITDSTVGWRFLCGLAQAAGFTGQAQLDFDDGSPPGEPPARKAIEASPFTLPDPTTIKPRAWLYGRHFIRKFLSATIAPGGVGKSALVTVEILAMVTGKNLLGERPVSPLRVWYLNLEDPPDELERRFAAACMHYGISPEDIGNRLFVNSGRDTAIVIAHDERTGLKIVEPVINALREEIRSKQIDVVVIDPFVASHGVPENDNGKINAVCRAWAMLADETGCAIELVHHTRKAAFGQGEYSVDDARGAGAMIAAVRYARTLNVMTKEQAGKAGLAEDQHRSFFRVDDGKANLAPPAERSIWRRHISVHLGNGEGVGHPGDNIGVVTAWEYPDPSDDVAPEQVRAAQEAVAAGEWRADPQAKDWVGKLIADVLDLDLAEPSVRAHVKALQKSWVKDGILKVVKRKNAKREIRPFVEVGKKVAA